MNRLSRRLSTLEGVEHFLTVGDLLDNLDGVALPADKVLPAKIATALAAMSDA